MLEKTDAIILAGGLGTRLRGTVPHLPKSLAPVNGKPFLDLLLGQIERFGLTGTVVLALGFKSDMIIKKYDHDARYPFDLRFSVEHRPLGTGGAIRKAMSMTRTQNVLVMNGDSYVEIDFNQFLTEHLSSKALVTLALSYQEDMCRFGQVEMNGRKAVTGFKEKADGPKCGFVNAGMYLVRKDCFDTVEEKETFSFERDFLPAQLDHGICGFVTGGKFVDIGVPKSYGMADSYLKGVCV